jgi:hypothetical protein
MGNLHFTATIDAAKFNRTLDDIEKRIKGIQDNTGQGNPFLNLSNLNEGYAFVQALGDIASGIVKVRGEFQQLETTFRALLKNKAAANELMQEVIKMAAETPFELKEIADGAKQLVIFGANAQTAVKDLQMLGDIAVGTATPVNELAAAYGALRQKGEASDDDLQQFASKGIPVYAELAKILNTSTENIKHFAEAGKVGFNEIQQAFTNMTSQGGMFNGLINQQSKTLQGSLAQLSNAFSNMFNGIVQDQEGFLSSAVSATTDLVNNYETVVDVLKSLIVAYGTYKAAVMAASVVQVLSTAAGNIGAWLSLAKSIRTAADAQVWFNLVSKANPYAIAAAAIAVAVLAVINYSENLSAAERAQRNLTEAEEQSKKQKEELVNSTNALINAIKNETSTRLHQMEAFQKLKELYPALYKEMDIDTFKKQDAIQAQKELNKVIDELTVTEAEDQYRKAIVKVEELGEVLKKLEKDVNDSNLLEFHETLVNLEAAKKELDVLNEKAKLQRDLYFEANTPLEEQITHYQKIKDNLEDAKKRLEDTLPPFVSMRNEADVTQNLLRQMRLQGLIFDLDETKTKLAQISDKLAKDKADFSISLSRALESNSVKGLLDLESLALSENQINALGQAVKKVKADLDKSSPGFKQLDAFYNRLTSNEKRKDKPAPAGSVEYWMNVSKKASEFLQKINPLSPKNTKAILEAQKQRLEAEFKVADLRLALDKNYADGSIESYEKIASNAAGLLTKINPEDARFKELLKVQLVAQQKADNLRKTLAIKTVDEEIEEKKKQYELYDLWVKHTGKDAADEHFRNLKNSGISFKEYLEKNINDIQSRIDTHSASDFDLENLVKYKSAIESINESIDDYKSKITSAGQELGSLTGYLQQLREEQAKLGNKDDAKKAFLADQILETEKKRKALLNDFFNEFNLQEQKRIEIQSKYNDLRAQLDVEYTDRKSEIYQNVLARINGQEAEALQKYDVDTVLKNSAGYKELQKVITGTEDYILKSRIENTKKVLEELKDLKNTDEYKKQLQSLIDLQEKLVSNHISFFAKIGGILSQFSKESKGFIGLLGELGTGLSNAAGNSSKLLEIGKIISATDKAVRNAQTTEEAVAAGALGAKKVQTAKLTMVADMAVQAINDIANTLKNRKEKEKAYYEVLINQQLTYNKLLNDEMRLKSQSGSLFSSDTASVINDSLLARADALKNYNASLGSLLESGKAKDGTQTGINVKKALTTFLYNPAKAVFGTTETRDKLTSILEKYPDLYDKAIGGVKGFNKELAQSLIASNAVDEATRQQLQTTLDWINQYELAQKQLQESIISMTGQIGEDLKNALVSAFKEGRSAAEAFGETVDKVIENIVTQAIYARMLKPVIDKFSKEVAESYATDENGVLIGDGSILDDVQRLRDYGLKAASDTTRAMEDARKEFEKSGINIFGKSDAGSNGLSGSIKSITEETAGVLEGQINAIRITQATNLEVNRSQLLALTTIANNSEYLKHLELLKSIDKKLSTGIDWRSGGVNV